MKALAINGSPRPGGNTEIMLSKVLEPLEAAGWDTEYLRIGGKPIRGCLACMKCLEKRNGRCIIEGDVVNECLEKMSAANAIILGSPTTCARQEHGLADETGGKRRGYHCSADSGAENLHEFYPLRLNRDTLPVEKPVRTARHCKSRPYPHQLAG